MELQEFKTLLDQQGTAFEAFKGMVDGELKKKANADDPIVKDKLTKIESDLDKAVEGKAALEAKIAATIKAHEDLELKLGRMNLSGHSKESAQREIEIKTLNDVLSSASAERKRPFTPLDAKGYEEYKSAWLKWATQGKDALSTEEAKTLVVGNDPGVGYFVTPDISGRIITKVYETSPMRQISSQQTIATDALEGMEDLGEAGAGYAGERATGTDTTTPEVGKWRIPVFWIDTQPKASQQILDDAPRVEGWLSGKVSAKFGRFENAEFISGAANKIRGVCSYATIADSGSGVTWGSFGHIATGTSAAFPTANPVDKFHDLIGALKSAYLGNATFLTRRSVVTLIRKFKDGVGNYMWQPSFVAGVSETLMGYPLTRAEDMPAVGVDSLSLAFGDFKEGYQIVDREGIRVLTDPYTAKPYTIFYTTKRTGGGALNFEAIKFMKFGAS